MNSGGDNQNATIFEVKDRHEPELRKFPGVTGVGVGPSDSGSGMAIKVYLAPSADGGGLPSQLEGYPVETEPLAPLRTR